MPIYKYKNSYPTISSNTYIAPSADIIGDVIIQDNSSIWFNTVIRGDVNYIRIGENTNIQDGSIIHVTRQTCPTIIGSNVTIGHKVLLHGCTIQDSILIGMDSTIMDRAVIESNVIIGAGSLVTQDSHIPSGYLAFGHPAKVIRKLTDKELAFLDISAQNYVSLKNEYL